MCLIVFDWRPDAPAARPGSAGSAGSAAGFAADPGSNPTQLSWPLLTLAANRDEFLERPAAPLGWWDDSPDVLAGRDLQAGGTWLGVNRDGRFAALTNYRAPAERLLQAVSRGALVADYLRQPPATWRHAAKDTKDTKDTNSAKRLSPLDYLHFVSVTADRYNGFNLLVGDLAARQLAWFSNRSTEPPKLLPAGLYGLSNALLDTPWPKVLDRKTALARLPDSADTGLDALLDLMSDTHIAADEHLPATGVPLERERALSAAYIDLPNYGTRSTVALRAGSNGDVSISERADDDGSHRLVRPGQFIRHFDFQVSIVEADRTV
jgi:uncharacterized protein with NRDE domain